MKNYLHAFIRAILAKHTNVVEPALTQKAIQYVVDFKN